MTTNDLRKYFSTTYGLKIAWPKKYKANHETFANVCMEIFTAKTKESIELEDSQERPEIIHHIISLGRNGGIYFKGVEIVLEEK